MAIPRDPTFEAGPDLLREGYEFIPNRCQRFRSWARPQLFARAPNDLE